MVVLRDAMGDTNRGNTGITIFRGRGRVGRACVASLFVVNTESGTTLMYLHGIRIHTSRVLDLRGKHQLSRVGNRRNVFHGIQNCRERDRGGSMKNKKVIHRGKFREKPRKFQRIVARVQRYRLGWEEVQKIPCEAKRCRRVDEPLQRSGKEEGTQLRGQGNACATRNPENTRHIKLFVQSDLVLDISINATQTGHDVKKFRTDDRTVKVNFNGGGPHDSKSGKNCSVIQPPFLPRATSFPSRVNLLFGFSWFAGPLETSRPFGLTGEWRLPWQPSDSP